MCFLRILYIFFNFSLCFLRLTPDIYETDTGRIRDDRMYDVQTPIKPRTNPDKKFDLPSMRVRCEFEATSNQLRTDFE